LASKITRLAIECLLLASKITRLAIECLLLASKITSLAIDLPDQHFDLVTAQEFASQFLHVLLHQLNFMLLCRSLFVTREQSLTQAIAIDADPCKLASERF